MRTRFENVLGIPFYEGNQIEVLRNGNAIFPAMLDAVEAAESQIDFLTYVYWEGAIAERFAQALGKKARSGVAVNVLLDSFGASAMARDLIELLCEAGVNVRWFRPLSTWKIWRNDNRTHRKILVIDGRVGFTGGVGIAEEWEGDARNASEWRDTHFRIEGPAVNGLRGAFLANWFEADVASSNGLDFAPGDLARTGDVAIQVVRATSTVGRSDIATLIRLMITSAQQRLRIATAFFVPDEHTLDDLCQVARRGVDVSIMMPGPHADSRLSQFAGEATIRALLDAGVSVYSYQPTMLHTKIITVDEGLACIGSANFNQRSMCKDEEIALIVSDPTITRVLDQHFEQDLEACHRITEPNWRRRSYFQRFMEAAIRPFRTEL
jgi:cardiolipin synthase